MGVHKHMIQEMVSQLEYRLMAISFGLGLGESFLSLTWVAARLEVYAMVQCNAHFLPNRAYWLGSPNRLAALAHCLHCQHYLRCLPHTEFWHLIENRLATPGSGHIEARETRQKQHFLVATPT